jgi:hypothetical protein
VARGRLSLYAIHVHEWNREYAIIARVNRRAFLTLLATVAGGYIVTRRLRAYAPSEWQTLLPIYTNAALGNIVEIDGRRAMLSSRLYPGTYVRDALFWGPLALDEPDLGYECYSWFAESQLGNGQIRSAVRLRPEDADSLEPKDDEGTLLFIIASDWLRINGFALTRNPSGGGELDLGRIERAYHWIEQHVANHRYLSPAGPFRYWADTVNPDRDETISHNQGLLCLARRAMVNIGLGGVTEDDVAAARSAWRAMYDSNAGYLPLGQYSNFARAQDNSAVFPEWLSRYLYDEPLLTDEMVVSHAARIVGNASVYDNEGHLAGIKIICGENGEFLRQEWFHETGLNPPGDYQNGGYWPAYTHIMLALAYSITHEPQYAQMVEALVRYELERDGHTKEMMRLSPGMVGTFQDRRADYTWNALIPVALRWAGVIS